MRFFRGTISFVAFLLFSGAAQAANQSDYDDCEQGADQQRRVAACTRVIQDQSEDPANRAVAYDNRGIAYKVNNDFDRAIADYNEAIRLNPKTATTYYNRGLAYEAKGDKVHATADFKKALKLKPDLTQARDELSKLATAHPASQQDYDDCNQESDSDRTIAGCAHLLEDPKESLENRAAAYRSRGDAYKAKGDNDRAIADYNEAIRLDPKFAAVYNERGLAYANKGDQDRAIADYGEAMRLAPTAAHPHNNLGKSYFAKGDPDRAIAEFTEAIQLDPKAMTPHRNRGIAYEAKGDHDRAIADFSEAIRLDPEAAPNYLSRGKAYAANGDHDRAIADFKKALELKPDYSEARQELSKLAAPADAGKTIDAAENWVDPRYKILIDVSSIRKGDDGLVYFNHRDKDPEALPVKRAFAFDCEKGLMYDSLFGSEWKSKGIAVTEGTPGEAWKTFVCSRVP